MNDENSKSSQKGSSSKQGGALAVAGAPSGGGGSSVAGGPGRGGFFSPYKSGQGKTTRVCTAVAAVVLIALIVHWTYTHLRIPLVDFLITDNRGRQDAVTLARNISLAVAGVLALLSIALAWKLMNSARGADFLITTDSEMKKVNWSSRKEIFGSTRVVVLFLLFIGTFLFVSDIFFGWFFYLIGVLRVSPFSG